MILRVVTLARVVWLEVIRRKDVYVLLILLGALLFILLSLNIFGLGAVVRYAMDVGLLFAWLFSVILVVTTTGRQLPQEERRRTIYPLLAKPVTRLELILGKWLGAWTVSTAATLTFYLLVALVVWLRGGRVEPKPFLQGIVLHTAMLGIVAAMTLWFSTRMNADAAMTTAFVAVAAAWFILPKVPEMLIYQTGAPGTILLVWYYLLPHMALFDMRQRIVHDWGPLPVRTWCALLAYGVLWMVLLLAFAWWGYRSKRLERGRAV